MNPANIFQLEVYSTLYHQRSLIMKLSFTLLLMSPFLIFNIPLKAKVYGLVFVLLFTSFFGAAVTFVRRRSEGHINYLKLLNYSKYEVVRDYILSSALVDIFQLLIPFTLFVLINMTKITLYAMLQLYVIYIVSILFFNILGLLLGFVMKSNAEVHLSGIFFMGILVSFSDLVPVSHKLCTFIRVFAKFNPVTYLFKAFNVLVAQGSVIPVGFIISFFCLLIFIVLFLLRFLNIKIIV